MANSREAQFQWDLIEAMTDYGGKAGTAGGCNHKGEEASELDLTYYHLTKREEKGLRLEETEGDYGFYDAEVSDDDKLHSTNGTAVRIELDEAVIAQVRNHSENQVMHGLFPKKVSDAVLDSLSDQEKLSMPLLGGQGNGEAFALMMLGLLARRSGRDE